MIRIILIVILSLILCGCGAKYPAVGQRDMAIASNYESGQSPTLKGETNRFATLSVPTCISKIGDWYFLVDCYHDQILVHDSLEDPLTEWTVMTSEIARGHTLAGDGNVYVADDTENNRVLVFTEQDGSFTQSQVIENVGVRPHYVVYDKDTELFWVWSSMTGEMYRYRTEENAESITLVDILNISELNGVYVRSFTMDGDLIYLPTADGRIFKTKKDTLEVEEIIEVPNEIAGMVQLMIADGDYYVTVSTDREGSQDAATIIRAKSLAKLSEGEYEDVYENFVGGGTPYFMTLLEGKYYLTEHRLTDHAIWQFSIADSKIQEVKSIY